MPLRRKSNINLNLSRQPVEKSLSSPDLSLGHERSQKLNEVGQHAEATVKRKKSWLSRFLSPFRKKRNRTITAPTTGNWADNQVRSGFLIQKSPSSQFYTTTPRDLLIEATRSNENEQEIHNNTLKHRVDLDNEDRNVPSSPTLSKVFVPSFPVKVIDELKSNVKVTTFNATENSNPGKDGNKTACNDPSKGRSQTSNEKQYHDIKHNYEKTWDTVDKSSKIDSKSKLNHTALRSEIEQNDTLDICETRLPYPEPQPIEPLHKFPKPKPPVKRRPSTRRGSRTAEDDSLMNPRRSQAELEEILEKLKNIPPPETMTPQETPIPKKRTKIPTPSKDDKSIIEVPTNENITGKLKINENETVKLVNDSELKLESSSREILDSTSKYNQSFLYKSPKQILRSNTLPKSILKNPESPISVSNLIQEFNNMSTDMEDQNIQPLKRWKTLPISYQWTNKPTNLTKIASSLDSQKSDTNHLDINEKFEICNKKLLVDENWTQTSDEDSFSVSKIKSQNFNQTHSVCTSNLDPCIEEFQRIMKKYINDLEYKRCFDQSTPPNTPEQFEKSNYIEDISIGANICPASFEESFNKVDSLITPIESANDDKITIMNEIYETIINAKSSITSELPEENASVMWNDEIFHMDSFPKENFLNKKIDVLEKSDNPVEVPEKKSQSKPLILPKPEGFVRKGAVRQKRRISSSGDQTPSHEISENQCHSSNCEIYDKNKDSQNDVALSLNYNSAVNYNLSTTDIQLSDFEKTRSNSIV